MKKLISLLMVGILLSMIIFFESRVSMPATIFTINGQIVPTVQGSYCWDGVLQSVCSDSLTPEILLKENEIETVFVHPGDRVKLKFTRTPFENSINVSNWSNDQENKAILDGNYLVLPEKRGVYIYVVSAKWERGSLVFSFMVEVE
ncbi:hypothetical protein [Niallia taxi]|uniref:hypothetical protein n=1 Tax=Niallia taxi TaxID=2499688 RepID=UPI0021A3F496|nr:hypothetical protein [Niallia taxi]MCT2343402.1 hypothetical protein [Niallia taxi]